MERLRPLRPLNPYTAFLFLSRPAFLTFSHCSAGGGDGTGLPRRRTHHNTVFTEDFLGTGRPLFPGGPPSEETRREKTVPHGLNGRGRPGGKRRGFLRQERPPSFSCLTPPPEVPARTGRSRKRFPEEWRKFFPGTAPEHIHTFRGSCGLRRTGWDTAAP